MFYRLCSHPRGHSTTVQENIIFWLNVTVLIATNRAGNCPEIALEIPNGVMTTNVKTHHHPIHLPMGRSGHKHVILEKCQCDVLLMTSTNGNLSVVNRNCQHFILMTGPSVIIVHLKQSSDSISIHSHIHVTGKQNWFQGQIGSKACILMVLKRSCTFLFTYTEMICIDFSSCNGKLLNTFRSWLRQNAAVDARAQAGGRELPHR